MFILGALCAGQLGALVGSRQRWWLIANNLFQFGLVFGASMVQAYLPGWDSAPATELIIDKWSMWVVGLLAFSAGGQVAVARSLHMTEITTANATSAYVDLLIDENLFRHLIGAEIDGFCF